MKIYILIIVFLDFAGNRMPHKIAGNRFENITVYRLKRELTSQFNTSYK